MLVSCGLVQLAPVRLCPEVQLIAAGSAIEAVELRTLDVDGELAMLTGTSRYRPEVAKLMEATQGSLKPSSPSTLHGDRCSFPSLGFVALQLPHPTMNSAPEAIELAGSSMYNLVRWDDPPNRVHFSPR